MKYAWHLATCCNPAHDVQVLITRQNDCILAETYMRLDHLESAMHNVRHEELINGIMMRLDHLSTDINHIKDHADDKVEEKKKQADFKQLVWCFETVVNRKRCQKVNGSCVVHNAAISCTTHTVSCQALKAVVLIAEPGVRCRCVAAHLSTSLCLQHAITVLAGCRMSSMWRTS